jgi:hypothetical protein
VDQRTNRRESLVTARIYVEGGGDNRELRARCREGFSDLLQRCGFAGRMPRLVAHGGREATYDGFVTAHAMAAASGEYVAMLVDSEEPIAAVDEPWRHLHQRDGWSQPPGAIDEQVLLMTTCMETWIIGDRGALTAHYGANLQESVLLALTRLEERPRGEVQDALIHATRNCPNRYAKGKRSFEVLSKLDPETLATHLPSFARAREILGRKL